MSRAKIFSHFVMWAVIFAGALLSFLFFPPKFIFKIESRIELIIAIPLAILLVNCLIKSINLRFKLKVTERFEEKLIKSGIYGRFEHPTCTCLIFFFWIVFLFFPDIRLFVANAWMTAVVLLFLEIEKSAYRKKKADKEEASI